MSAEDESSKTFLEHFLDPASSEYRHLRNSSFTVFALYLLTIGIDVKNVFFDEGTQDLLRLIPVIFTPYVLRDVIKVLRTDNLKSEDRQ